jgi:hypothetical protein
MPRSRAGDGRAKVRSFYHAECRSLTHGGRQVQPFPVRRAAACSVAVELSAMTNWQHIPALGWGCVGTIALSNLWSAACGRATRPARWHVRGGRCAYFWTLKTLSSATRATARNCCWQPGRALSECYHGQRLVISAGIAVSQACPPIAAASSRSRYIIACAQTARARPSNNYRSPWGKAEPAGAPTTDSFFARFTDGRCALRFFPGSSCAPASNAIYLASRTFLKFSQRRPRSQVTYR